MHKKKAGKLQNGSTFPKQYWLAVNGKPKIHLWGLSGKTRKCPIGTVSVYLKKNDVPVGKLMLYESDVENSETKQVGNLLVIVTFVIYHFA